MKVHCNGSKTCVT